MNKPHDMSKAQERSERFQTRESIKEKRALLKDVNKHKTIALTQARAAIKQSKVALRRKLAHWKELNRQILARAIEAERHHAKAEALERMQGTKTRAGDLARAALAAVDTDLKHLKWLGYRKIHAKNPARVQAATRAAERRSESDEAVKLELPTEFHAAWEENKHKIKPKRNAARWEVALEWMHEHGAEVAEANRRQEAVDLKETIKTEAAYYADREAEQKQERARKIRTRAKGKTLGAKRDKARREKRAPKGYTRSPVMERAQTLARTATPNKREAAAAGNAAVMGDVERVIAAANAHTQRKAQAGGKVTREQAGAWNELTKLARAERAEQVPF